MAGEDILQVELVPHTSIKHKNLVLLWGEHLEGECVGSVVGSGRSAVNLVQWGGRPAVDLVQCVVIVGGAGNILPTQVHSRVGSVGRALTWR